MRTEGSHKALAFAVGTFMLFGGYFAYASYLSGTPSTLPFVQTISAKDGEDDEDEGEDTEEDDSDEDKEDEKVEKEKEKAAERKKKEDEKKREDAKKAAERAYKSSRSGSGSGVELRGDGTVDDDSIEDESDDDFVNGVKVRGDGSVDDDFDENEAEEESDDDSRRGDREGMYKDQAKTLKKLNEKIAEAEKHILEKQAEGVDVTAALAQLALAKEGLGSVDAAFVANDLDKIKELAKSTEKLAHFSQGKTLHDSEESAKDIAKVAKRIAQTEEKIAYLKAMGGDATIYESSLSEAKSAFADAKAKIALGGSDLLAGLTALEGVERRVKSIKNSIEGALLALGVSDDDEFEAEHDEDVEDDSDDLIELAEADEDHSSLKNLAETHKEEAVKVSGLVARLDDRSRIVRGLVGNDADILNELQNEVAINEARIAAMKAAVTEIEDESLSELMEEKIGDLKSENAKLANFISSQSLETGVFGWFFKLF